MKKLSLFSVALTLSTLGLGTFAAAQFSDENDFASWFADSVKKMQYNEIITGYPDGSFRAENPVTRAELSVILDRFAKNIFKKELATEPTMCTTEFQYGLIINLQDQEGKLIDGAQVKVNGVTSDFDGLDGKYAGLGEKEGYFTFKIEKEGYTSHSETIKLEKDDCHVIPQERTITLIKL